ncbi:MAG: hypothetical protein WCG01_04285 [bacterium]
MCKAADQTMILTMLLPNRTYHGVLVMMPTGKHKFYGLLGEPMGKGKHLKYPPLFTGNHELKLEKLIKQIKIVSQLKPEEGVFKEVVSGTKDDIWSAKMRLDNQLLKLAA